MEECKMSKKCFFICPIGDDESKERKRSNTVMKHLLNPVCKDKGYDIIRADLIASANKISVDIIEHLENDDLAIADLTDCNPNVFYEIGYRKAKCMPTIHIAKKETRLPFDTIDDRAIFYDETDLDTVENFEEQLSKTIDSISSIKKPQVFPNLVGVIVDDTKVESPYISLLRAIVNEFNSNGRRPVIYASDEVDENNIEVLSSMGYIKVKTYINGVLNVKPTGLGLQYVIDNQSN